MEAGELRDCDVSTDVVLSDTMDQFRTFQMCEKLLHSPSKLANQLLFQIPPQKQAMMIERYTHTHTHTHTTCRRRRRAGGAAALCGVCPR